MDQNELK